jgi:hypothetical protein
MSGFVAWATARTEFAQKRVDLYGNARTRALQPAHGRALYDSSKSHHPLPNHGRISEITTYLYLLLVNAFAAHTLT